MDKETEIKLEKRVKSLEKQMGAFNAKFNRFVDHYHKDNEQSSNSMWEAINAIRKGQTLMQDSIKELSHGKMFSQSSQNDEESVGIGDRYYFLYPQYITLVWSFILKATNHKRHRVDALIQGTPTTADHLLTLPQTLNKAPKIELNQILVLKEDPRMAHFYRDFYYDESVDQYLIVPISIDTNAYKIERIYQWVEPLKLKKHEIFNQTYVEAKDEF